MAAFEPDSQLDATFVHEVLFTMDILGEGQPGLNVGGKEHAFSVLYEDYLQAGGKVDGTIAQLGHDNDNALEAGLGVATFDSGELAPPLKEVTIEAWSRDHDGTFASLVNPNNCDPGDTRVECLQALPQKDPRYADQPMWVHPLSENFKSQPLDEALRAFKAQQDAIRLRMRSVDPNATLPSPNSNNSSHLRSFVAIPPVRTDITRLSKTSFCQITQKPDYVQMSKSQVRLDDVPITMLLSADTHLNSDLTAADAATAAAISNVQKLTSSSTELQLGMHLDRDMVVAFQAPWCPQSETLNVALNGFSSQLDFNSVTVATVDVDAQPDVVKRFKITQLPLVVYFPKGQPIHLQAIHMYEGLRTSEAMLQWFKSRQEVAAIPTLTPSQKSKLIEPETASAVVEDTEKNTAVNEALRPSHHNMVFGYTNQPGGVEHAPIAKEEHGGFRVEEKLLSS